MDVFAPPEKSNMAVTESDPDAKRPDEAGEGDVRERRGRSMLHHYSSMTPLDSDRLVNRLKNTNLEKFHTMCKMHLSFLLDMCGSGLEEFLGECDSPAYLHSPAVYQQDKSKLHLPFGKKSKVSKENKCPGTGIFGAQISQDVIEHVYPVMDFLCRPENIRQEGLFRKSGQIGRQRAMRARLELGEDLGLDAGDYSAHDCASLLKTFLSELPEPLLTDKHQTAYCQVLDVLSEEKQLQVLQLLIQLLPRDSYVMLECLLDLLHRVANEPDNKMATHSLGVLFAPHFLVPKKMTASEIHAIAPSITKIVTMLIEYAPELFKAPEALVRDIATYWDEMEEAVEGRSAKSDDELDSSRLKYKRRMDPNDVVINTTVTFADRQASLQAAAQTDTEMALAQLYAHISTMPDSSKKHKLLKQFNKANGIGTPAAGSPRHKRSKSLGDSIKKFVKKNHKRQEAALQQQFIQPSSPVSTVPSCPCPSMSGHGQHTPMIRRAFCPTTPPIATPVSQLFKQRLTQPVLPDSPRVHIVDMKALAGGKLNRGKRKEPGLDSPICSGSVCSSLSSISSMDSCHDNDSENYPSALLHHNIGGRLRQSSHHPPGVMTPDRQFEKPTAFISPITKSINKAPRTVQTIAMTPRSRQPMVVIQTP